jgi:hypothetical protein
MSQWDIPSRWNAPWKAHVPQGWWLFCLLIGPLLEKSKGDSEFLTEVLDSLFIVKNLKWIAFVIADQGRRRFRDLLERLLEDEWDPSKTQLLMV